MSEQQKKDTGYDKDRKDSNKKTKLNSKNKLIIIIALVLMVCIIQVA